MHNNGGYKMNIEKEKSNIELATTFLEDGAFITARDILLRVVDDLDDEIKRRAKLEKEMLTPTKPKRGRPPKKRK